MGKNKKLIDIVREFKEGQESMILDVTDTNGGAL